MDVPLSALGEQQADALGRWFGRLPPDARPTVVLCSPYVRARQTALRLLRRGRPVRRRTARRARRAAAREGVRHPRPPDACTASASATPSWRRSARTSASSTSARPAARAGATSSCACAASSTRSPREHRGERVLIVAHQVIVNCMRYLLERHDEEQILRHRPRGRRAELRRHRVRASMPTPGRHGKLALRCVQLRRAARGGGRAGHRRAGPPGARPRHERRRRHRWPPRVLDADALRGLAAAGAATRRATRSAAAACSSSPAAARCRARRCSPALPRCAPAPARCRSPPSSRRRCRWRSRCPRRVVAGLPATRRGRHRPGRASPRCRHLLRARRRVLVGPGMRDEAAAAALVDGACCAPFRRAPLVLDATAMAASRAATAALRARCAGRGHAARRRDGAPDRPLQGRDRRRPARGGAAAPRRPGTRWWR